MLVISVNTKGGGKQSEYFT